VIPGQEGGQVLAGTLDLSGFVSLISLFSRPHSEKQLLTRGVSWSCDFCAVVLCVCLYPLLSIPVLFQIPGVGNLLADWSQVPAISV
jgi:hypothetical protein